ncbi:uncharacterized protein LOC135212935 isoform X2 [Macrobrachium nipponense]|uniref:uncharacterized protein LOC135212935 isoform X2 n=1 Tax=Macrobrachium nipponense TaxID=159736 RepID=UPI0030C7DB16
MSWSLVKRGIELFDDDELTAGSGSLKNKIDQSKTDPTVSTHRHGIHRAAKHKKRIQLEKKAFHSQLVEKKVRNALKQYENSRPVDCTKKNIKLLKKLDEKVTKAHAEKITNHHEKNLKERITKSEWSERQKKKDKDAGSSVFTDEDFKKMNDVWLRLNN